MTLYSLACLSVGVVGIPAAICLGLEPSILRLRSKGLQHLFKRRWDMLWGATAIINKRRKIRTIKVLTPHCQNWDFDACNRNAYLQTLAPLWGKIPEKLWIRASMQAKHKNTTAMLLRIEAFDCYLC